MKEKHTTQESTLELNLFDNACDSLSEAIRKYEASLGGDKTALKHAVLYLSHFVELFLKTYVAKQHPLLIFANPSGDITKNDAKTITINDAIKILQNCGIKIPRALGGDIDKLSKKRNQITHYKVSIDSGEFVKRISRLLADITIFDRINLGLNICDHINEDVWAIVSKNVDDEIRKLEAAENEAKKRWELAGVDSIETCPKCYHETTYTSEDLGMIKCAFCDYTSEAAECTSCNRYLPDDEFCHEELCNECAEESDYGEYLYELHAGK